LRLAVGAASLSAVSLAWAQTYPSRPVRIVVGFPAGSAADLLARLFGQRLSERLGQPFIIENRPGAGSNIATDMVAHSPPDGHTLLMITGSNAVNATLYDKLDYNFIRDSGHPHDPRAACPGVEPVGRGQNRSRTHRICQSQSRQGQDGVGW